MASFTRKDFLKLASLSFAATLLPTEKINALTFILDLDTPGTDVDYISVSDLAREAKTHFYKKEYPIAEEKYRECIRLAPGDVRFYDGLDNVFGAQGRFLESLLLYKNGLTINSQNVAFYDRTARALMRVGIGDKKLAETYKRDFSSDSMLDDALNLYEQAISIDSTKRYLQVGKNKVAQKISLNAVHIDFRKAFEYKKTKRELAKQLHLEVYDLPLGVLIEQFYDHENKKRNELFNSREIQRRANYILQDKKKKASIIFDKYYKQRDYANAGDWAVRMFELDPAEQQAIVRLKKSFYKQGKYKEVIAYRREFAEHRENAFSYLGVLDAVERAAAHNQADSSDFNLAHEIGFDLLHNWGLMEQVAIDVIDKYNRILIIDNRLEQAIDITERALQRFETRKGERINKILHSYALLFESQGRFSDVVAILRLALKEEVSREGVGFNYDLVAELAGRKRENHFIVNYPIYCMLYGCYISLGRPDLAEEILNVFRINSPTDSFLRNKV